MAQELYIDVLFVTNYIINMLLIMCTGKLSGRSPARRGIVLASLFASIASLTIFLPYLGFFVSVLLKLTISAAIVLIAFSFISAFVFLKQLFLFFAVSFSLAGAVLGIWLFFAPNWITYYNGILYFDVSPFALIITTTAAYILLILADRIVKAKKLTEEIVAVSIRIRGKEISLTGLVDTGNRLREPFTGFPVIVCYVPKIAYMLPPKLAVLALEGSLTSCMDCGTPVRLVPYSDIGGSGILPAVKADFVIIMKNSHTIKIEQVYIGLSNKQIGDERYSCLLPSDLIGIETKKNTVVPHK
ncbi:MAG: sigma-E processing peptidase SpoIIGA [Oscillospiraceae bacterium]|nr:sigma-E processing peptidase SpoIIGA [Oscillospiraceae bacterium]